MKTKKRYALYCRVSTTEQTNENQKLRLIQYAKDKKLDCDLFEETQSTRKTRPVKQEVLNRLRNGEYAGIIVYKICRYARSSSELILEVKELTDKGISFISISDNLDFGSASGKLHFQILSAFAEFERELIRERTIEGLRRAKMQGKTLGRPKGAKDKKARRKSGYILRHANELKKANDQNGVFNSVESYLNNTPPNNNKA